MSFIVAMTLSVGSIDLHTGKMGKLKITYLITYNMETTPLIIITSRAIPPPSIRHICTESALLSTLVITKI